MHQKTKHSYLDFFIIQNSKRLMALQVYSLHEVQYLLKLCRSKICCKKFNLNVKYFQCLPHHRNWPQNTEMPSAWHCHFSILNSNLILQSTKKRGNTIVAKIIRLLTIARDGEDTYKFTYYIYIFTNEIQWQTLGCSFKGVFVILTWAKAVGGAEKMMKYFFPHTWHSWLAFKVSKTSPKGLFLSKAEFSFQNFKHF